MPFTTVLTAFLLSQQSIPQEQLDNWVKLLNRLFVGPIEYQVEVTQAWISLDKLTKRNPSLEELLAIQSGEGMYGTYDEVVEAFQGLQELIGLDGAEIDQPITYRVARSSRGKLIQECMCNPANHFVTENGVTATVDTGPGTLSLSAENTAVRFFEPVIIMQPCPFLGEIQQLLVRPWIKVAEATYRTYYSEEDHSQQRSTVRMEEPGVPLGFWVRRQANDDSIVAVLYQWAKTEEGLHYPSGCVSVVKHRNALVAKRYRTMHWMEPIDDSQVVVAIPRPSRIYDHRNGPVKTIPSFEDLPRFIQEMFALVE